MILVDADILSALAKIGRLPLLFSLLRTTQLQITPGVFREVAQSLALRRPYAETVVAVVATGQLQVLSLTPAEAAFRDALSPTLGTGERESMAIAKVRGGTVLSNEARVAHYCRQHEIPCVRLPAILRALWVEGIATKQDVEQMIIDLQTKDHMHFKPATLATIVAEE
jgi:predicted nucleic acid-binding protein